jgi:hypothetical protein
MNRLRQSVVLAALGIVVLATPTLAASAQHISLGQFGPTYVRLLPFIVLAFVVLGFAMAISRAFHILSGMGRGGMIEGQGRNVWHEARATELLTSLAAIVVLVVVAIFLAYNWVDIINAGLDFFYSLLNNPIVTNS